MNPFQYLKYLNHHAYFIHSFKDGIEKLKEYLKNSFGVSHKQNPDFYHEKFEVLGIDESRRIKEIHQSKSFAENSKRIFVIEAFGITHEAQNALLKIFEEPNENTHFFLFMPTIEALLPTLRSRLSIIKINNICDDSITINNIDKFLTLSKKDKIAFVDEIAKDISDEKLNKSDAIEFLNELEAKIYKKNGANSNRELNAIIKAREYLRDRSPSVKQLLEYVALSM